MGDIFQTFSQLRCLIDDTAVGERETVIIVDDKELTWREFGRLVSPTKKLPGFERESYQLATHTSPCRGHTR